MSERAITEASSYTDRILKLVPAEFVAAYLAIHNAIASTEMDEGRQFEVSLASSLLLLAILPFYSDRILGIRSKRQNVAAAISFMIWVISLGGVLESFAWYLPVYSTIAIIIWTLAAPLLVTR